MSKNKDKTNVMRFLDQKKIDYIPYQYETDGSLTGIDVALKLNKNMNSVFKTLVTVGKSNQNYVFVIPVDRELDLKKAAEASEEKSIRMIPSRELLVLTGYIHGGCSPLCMKKKFKTFIDEEANNHESITFSAGKIGYQVEIKIENLKKILNFKFFQLT
ncbi:Cys-tRNA(Pro) deacylase [Helcococcus ovis]|uniref:Cys-tRNA(Pro)/Cys-tRNA(Cys) deacylase n=1 Tax=Helcococcus ovis TaxID=72026 RepID=A0A4R9C1V5_9FIRM|nr:Cys-tRNA(Pro) deacylase [Helcococcus ovis]TFF65062.1 Cys-tRNA(Pro) deacylase [Helcococcus ovis]TFF65927.1 Cys-tRNA(Pro) deacylase [Helcococcus ovis]TFF66812.1 Cys-tRNA(Pro) deacylase [Helcococcus ovis]WNZ01037.1 Cys-tRNA(Pro) deacylase [Helcococcus ovis]